MIVHQTNLYSVQVLTKSIDTNADEMKTFLSILLIMGIVELPAYRDYWNKDCRIDCIANNMALKRFEKLRRYIHFCDNTSINENDRFAKIRPLLASIRDNLLKIEPEADYSIDESMIPYKGKRAGHLRQYIKNKPKKWGFKFFIRAGVSGIVYDFLPYGGSSTFFDTTFDEVEKTLGTSAQFVTVLCRTIPDGLHSQVFMDNFFTSIELIEYLKSKNLHVLGTIRKDRLRNCTLLGEKELKKRGRGSYDSKTAQDAGITVVSWVDNKVVILASSFLGIEPLGKVQRYDKGE